MIAKELAERLPNTLILPSFGNNDWYYHYQSPYDSDQGSFYTFMFE